MSLSDALGDDFGNFEGQDDAESTTHFTPIISSEPIHRPPSPPSSLIAQSLPCTDDPRRSIEACAHQGEMLSH